MSRLILFLLAEGVKTLASKKCGTQGKGLDLDGLNLLHTHTLLSTMATGIIHLATSLFLHVCTAVYSLVNVMGIKNFLVCLMCRKSR